MLISVYGETRFNITYNPCSDDIDNLCPLNARSSFMVHQSIANADFDTSSLLSLMQIPDLEGFARMTIFSNSTQEEIGCFQAAMTNGHTFSQPRYVASILGAFVFCAVISSFITAIYGVRVKHIRTHYAHSISVLVVFETLQSIFLSGAISVYWPGLLPAWWSNFAWTVGMIATDSLTKPISSFTGNAGNTSQVGGGRLDFADNKGEIRQQIFGRSVPVMLDPHTASTLLGRAEESASDPYSYSWHGKPRTPGLPLPGRWPGLGGTLSVLDIPSANALVLGLIWLAVVLAAVAVCLVLAKLVIEALMKLKIIKNDGFDYFRQRWLEYLASGLLRTLYIAFFSMTTLATFQFSLKGRAAATALAAVTFGLFLFGVGGFAVLACFMRLRHGKFEVSDDAIQLHRIKFLKKLPGIGAARLSRMGEAESEKSKIFAKIPFLRVQHVNNEPERAGVHADEWYIRKFGWLSGRYRRTRWWFFTVYLAYVFIRACFLGGASGMPQAQVYGLFTLEILAFVLFAQLNPFESNRNTFIAIWMLPLFKIICTGLTIPLLPQFELSRIAVTVIGFVILILQGFLVVTVLVLVVLGILSSWMSLTRNRENFPAKLDAIRVKYYEHIERRAKDLPPRQRETAAVSDAGAQSFGVKNIRRESALHEDVEADGFDAETIKNTATNRLSSHGRSRANSGASWHSNNSIPPTGRESRSSWTTNELAEWDAESSRSASKRMSRARSNSLRAQVNALQARPMTPARESMEDSSKVDPDSGPSEQVPPDVPAIEEPREEQSLSNFRSSGPLETMKEDEEPESAPLESSALRGPKQQNRKRSNSRVSWAE